MTTTNLLTHLENGGIYVGSEIGNIDNFYLLRMEPGTNEICREELRERKRSLENALRIIKDSRKKFVIEMKKLEYEPSDDENELYIYKESA